MNSQEIYVKTEECINRFKNGQERYNTSPTFNVVVQMLVRGVDPFDVIDQLCQMSDYHAGAIMHHLHKDVPSLVHTLKSNQ